MKHITLDSSHAHPLSYADASMRLFEYDGTLLRGVNATHEPHIRELFDKGVVDALIERRLFVQTEISQYSSQDYPLILKHEKIPIITYPTEWPPEALRAAGMTVLDLQEALLDRGHMVVDINPWNILFRRTRPVFVDFGSIWQWSCPGMRQFVDEFNRYYLWPLLLARKGLWRYVVHLFSDYNNGVRHGDALLLLSRNELSESMTFLEKVRTSWLPSGLRRMLPEQTKKHLRRLRSGVQSRLPATSSTRQLRTQIDRLRGALSAVTLPKADAWTRYYEEFPKHGHRFDEATDWNQKQLNVRHILGELSPESVFDVCANRGWYSLLAEAMGFQVLSADVVPEVMNQLYLRANDGDHDIYPVVMDFCYPSPARGVANNWFKAATQRFRSELVMCLAAIHHLVWWSQLSFDQIVAGLASFSERWLLVEFVPREDETAGEYWAKRKHDWYTEPNFVRALEHRFRVRKTFSSFPETRKLFLCERRDIA